MYQFTYHRVDSARKATNLAEKNEDAKFLAGGMTMLPTMKQRLAAPSAIIDLNPAADKLSGIEVKGRNVHIGAMTRHFDVANSKEVREAIPALAELAGMIGDPAVRHRGTIGGSVANNDPAADYPSALLALGATVVTNKRQIAADKFFKGLFETALKDDEVVTSVIFTAPAKAGYAKFPNPASRYAMTGVFVTKGKEGVRAAVTGAGDDGVFRSKEIEAALTKKFEASALEGVSVPSKNLMADLHASPEYRANLVVVMAKRAVMAANA